jgi:hypothetical protein
MATYKIRRFHNGKNKAGDPFINYSLTIPTKIAEQLPTDMKFTCEVTNEGLLFRPVENEAPTELPAWASNGHKGD